MSILGETVAIIDTGMHFSSRIIDIFQVSSFSLSFCR